MSEMVEHWREAKEQRKEKRRGRMEIADEALPRLRELAAERDLTIQVPGTAHWLVRNSFGKAVMQYWPSANKAQFLKTGKKKQLTLEKFEECLRKGRF